MELVDLFEKLVLIYRPTRRHTPYDLPNYDYNT
jgi:hypothetical protein